MAKVSTVNIKTKDGYAVINKDEFNPTAHELFLKDDEILVKPLNVENADPFVIAEKDFDERSYEQVSATKKNLDIVAEQTDRQTLGEAVEKSGALDEGTLLDQSAKTAGGKTKDAPAKQSTKGR